MNFNKVPDNDLEKLQSNIRELGTNKNPLIDKYNLLKNKKRKMSIVENLILPNLKEHRINKKKPTYRFSKNDFFSSFEK